MTASANDDLLGRLCDLVSHLRSPDGCPWDRRQSLTDLRAYLLEEAHEVAAAVDTGDWREVGDELGDLLFQIAFIIRLGEEQDVLSRQQVIDRIEEKMIRRHPHVYGDEELDSESAVRRAWSQRKQRQEKGRNSILEGVAPSLPALTAAYRLSQKAADAGFDWQQLEDVLTKVEEEWAELRRELELPSRSAEAFAELGDLLFGLVNVARHLGFDPEAALGSTNHKFRRRFASIERDLRLQGRELTQASLEELEELWQRAKIDEAAGPQEPDSSGPA